MTTILPIYFIKLLFDSKQPRDSKQFYACLKVYEHQVWTMLSNEKDGSDGWCHNTYVTYNKKGEKVLWNLIKIL